MEESAREPLHVLILTDRDWTHPQGGGTGTNLFGQVSRWIAWGHRVTVVSCSYEGAAKTEQIGPLTIHRVGGRSTVFPRVIFRGLTGRLPKADVVLEVINGITFLSPLWLRSPRLALVHHVHRDHYVAEMGLLGRIAAWFLETAPLRLIYRGTRFLTISEASKADLERTGVDGERIDVGYIGVELGALEPAPEKRAPEPTLLFLGRLKRYKRIELVLDALEAVPEATLDMAGEGDHGEALWQEIQRRGLESRVRMLGHVDEDRKAELLQSTWGNLTASSAEGWCLTVMEAAACGTPSVALRVGGLPESIAHERTGLLAHDVEELQECTQRLVREPELRERLGHQARERAVEFSWDGTASRTMSLLEREHDRVTEQPSLIKRFTNSDTGRAAALGGSMLANNFIALIFTVVFARLLGASGYGSLGALVAAFAVLLVPGSALQTTAAREVSTAVAEGLEKPGVEVRRWLERIMLLLGVTLALGIFLREPMASLVGVEDEWAAGAILPTGALWLAICIQRGALQGLGRYVVVGSSIVAEAGLRLMLGLVLYGIGLGVTGAFLGQAAALVVLFLALLIPLLPTLRTPATGLVGRATRLRDLFGRAWVPILGFTLIAALQNIDIVWVKREIGGDEAGSYAAASVAAKAVIWIAIGLGLYLLPEAVKRTRTGGDARPVLGKSLGLIALVALPMIVLYAFFGKQVMGAVFGDDLTAASSVLPFLALAMALLACAYLAVQYLIALERANFLPVLGLAAAAELILLPVVGAVPTNVALVVVALQLAMLPVFFALVTPQRAAKACNGSLHVSAARTSGLGRVIDLWRLFRSEKTDPEPFYRALADEAVADLERRHGALAGRRVLDMGCGPGFYTDAFRRVGAEVIPVDNDPAEMAMVGDPPEGALVADAGDVPLESESVDAVFCSNLLEHTPKAEPVLAEMERVLRPGGWGYVSWTNWWSPWGGHDMTPWHYLGPRYGPRLYERFKGPPRKNPYGAGLWARHIGQTLKLVRSRPRLHVDRVEPRYWPRLSFLCRIPVVREFVTWNCVIRVRKGP